MRSFKIDSKINELHWKEGLSLFRDEAEKYQLSSTENTYMITQYFPYFRYYTSNTISVYNVNIFKRIITSNLIPSAKYCNLDKYIDDYLWTLENEGIVNYPKPWDYLCEIGLKACSKELDVVFWLCRFIIDACNNLSSRIIGKATYADCFDDQAETIEDLSLSALFALHRHYSFHHNDYMGLDMNPIPGISAQ